MKLFGKTKTIGKLAALLLITTVTIDMFSPRASVTAASTLETTPTTVSAGVTETLLGKTPKVIQTTLPVVDTKTLDSKVDTEVRQQEALEEQIKAELEAERKRRAEEKRKRLLAERKAYIKTIVCDPINISRVSGLKAEDYKYLTKGTWWEGNEQALVDLEKNHGVNAMFAMSVSTLESSSGTSSRARNRHNYYGLELSTHWGSLYDNTQSWGRIISEYYIGSGRTSVWNIGPKYCPPNRDWEAFMNDNMKKLYSSLIINLNNTLE